MNSQKYKCCFCGQHIESNDIDITSLVVLSNWDKRQDLQQEQQLFCHMECLRNRIDVNIPLYIADIID